jgi:hypothetical protein
MTRLTFNNPLVIKSRHLPIDAVGVANDARARIVSIWEILLVARLTLSDTHMVELKGLPVLNNVAVLTVVGKVIRIDRIRRRFNFMTALTFRWSSGVLTTLVAGSAFNAIMPTGEGIDTMVDFLAQKRNGQSLQ